MSACMRKQPCTTVIDLDFSSDSDSADDLVAALRSTMKMPATTRASSNREKPNRPSSSPLSPAPSDIEDIDFDLDIEAPFNSFERSQLNTKTEASSLELHQSNDDSNQDSSSTQLALEPHINTSTKEDNYLGSEVSNENSNTACQMQKPRGE